MSESDSDIEFEKVVYVGSSRVLGPKRAAIEDSDALDEPPKKARRTAAPTKRSKPRVTRSQPNRGNLTASTRKAGKNGINSNLATPACVQPSQIVGSKGKPIVLDDDDDDGNLMKCKSPPQPTPTTQHNSLNNSDLVQPQNIAKNRLSNETNDDEDNSMDSTNVHSRSYFLKLNEFIENLTKNRSTANTETSKDSRHEEPAVQPESNNKDRENSDDPIIGNSTTITELVPISDVPTAQESLHDSIHEELADRQESNNPDSENHNDPADGNSNEGTELFQNMDSPADKESSNDSIHDELVARQESNGPDSENCDEPSDRDSNESIELVQNLDLPAEQETSNDSIHEELSIRSESHNPDSENRNDSVDGDSNEGAELVQSLDSPGEQESSNNSIHEELADRRESNSLDREESNDYIVEDSNMPTESDQNSGLPAEQETSMDSIHEERSIRSESNDQDSENRASSADGDSNMSTESVQNLNLPAEQESNEINDETAEPTNPSAEHSVSEREETRNAPSSNNSNLPNFDSIAVNNQIKCGSKWYEIEKWDGDSPVGAFGKVALGKEMMNDVHVAIKISKPLECNKSEAEILLHLSKDTRNYYVINYFGHIEKDGLFYLVVERLDKTLEQAVDGYNDFVPLPFINNVSRQMFKGLEFLRKKGVIHKDIKAENVMIGFMDSVKFVDFGSATMKGKGGDGCLPSHRYRSPEVLLGGEHSYPADLWSVAMLCYYMWAKGHFFYGVTDGEMLYSICELFIEPFEPLDAPKFNEFFKRNEGTNRFHFIEKERHECVIGETRELQENHTRQYGEFTNVPNSCFHFLDMIILICAWNAERRPSPTDVLKMPFFTNFSMTITTGLGPLRSLVQLAAANITF